MSRAIETADILLGAERLLAPYQPKVEKRPYYKAEQILPYLQEVQKELLPEGGKVVILFSGDSGFYSGAGVLYRELMNAVRTGVLEGEVRILPGISSVSGLASRIKESWQDAAILSMHGKSLPGLAGRIKREEKTFLLMSGVKDLHSLGKFLLQAEMQDCEITAGYQLSYPEEKILYLTPEACGGVTEEGLYTCFIRNPHFERKRLTPGRADREFLRAEREKDRVPMTKEEVREVSICKLKLREGAVCYDIGSGTGSIAVELAELSDTLQVFAIERKRRQTERNSVCPVPEEFRDAYCDKCRQCGNDLRDKGNFDRVSGGRGRVGTNSGEQNQKGGNISFNAGGESRLDLCVSVWEGAVRS